VDHMISGGLAVIAQDLRLADPWRCVVECQRIVVVGMDCKRAVFCQAELYEWRWVECQ
jgi:hypothetical protein